MAFWFKCEWLADPAWFLGDFERCVRGVVCAERVVALFRGVGTPVCVNFNRNAIYEYFGPFHIGSCFEVRVEGSDVVTLVAALDISDYVMGSFI